MTTTKLDCLDIVMNHGAVEQFVERLATFSLVDWLSVANLVTKTASSRTAATDALDRVIAQHGLAFDAWSIGDDVETAYHCSIGVTGFAPSPRNCGLLRIAREAATTAAVALFVGSLLTPAGFESLYRPFESLVPRPVGSNSRRPATPRPPIRCAPTWGVHVGSDPSARPRCR